MRALILAAGTGSRMGPLTRACPKCMLPFAGRPLLHWQADALRRAGFGEIGVVAGYRAEMVDCPGARVFINPDYEQSNMVASLMCARSWFDKPLLAAYADLLYEPRLARGLEPRDGQVLVAADSDWRALWAARFGDVEHDLESFAVDDGGRVTDLGRPMDSSQGLDLRYVGLVGFSVQALAALEALWAGKIKDDEPWSQSGNSPRQGYMTDALHELNLAGIPVMGRAGPRGWFEVDTPGDYALLSEMRDQGRLNEFVDLGEDE